MSAYEIIEKVFDARPVVVDLARALSLAAHVDAALTRRIRLSLFPHRSDVTAEADLWTSQLVHMRSGNEITLRSDVQEIFWRELRSNRSELDACWLALLEARPAGRPLRDLEEELTYYALTNDTANLDAALGTVVNAMLEDASRLRDLSAWSARALARLPENVRESETGRVLATVAAGRVATPVKVATLTPKQQGLRVVDRLLEGQTRRKVAIRCVGSELHVAASLPPPAIHIDVSPTNPVLVVDQDPTYRIDLRGLTRIPIDRFPVKIGTPDGRRWIIAPRQARPNHEALVAIREDSERVAYIINAQLAVTSSRGLNRQFTLTLEIANGIRAKVIAADDAADVALLLLQAPVATSPLRLGLTVHQGEVWQAFTTPAELALPVDDGKAMAVIAVPTPSWVGSVSTGAPALTLRWPPGTQLPKPGTPIFIDDRVIGHVRRESADSPVQVAAAAAIEALLHASDRPDLRDSYIVIVTTGSNEMSEQASRELKALATAQTRILIAASTFGDFDDADVELAAFLASPPQLDLLPVAIRDHLIDLLLQFYSDRAEALDLAVEAGLDRYAIPDRSAGRELWTDILEIAARRGMTRRLLATTRRRLPEDNTRVELLDALLAGGRRFIRLVGIDVAPLRLSELAVNAGVELEICDSIERAADRMKQLVDELEGLDGSTPHAQRRVWINSRRAEDAPEQLQLQGAATVSKHDLIVLFVGEDNRRWPAALYEVVGGRRITQQMQAQQAPTPTSAELECRLVLQFDRPNEHLFEMHADAIRRIASSTSQRDTRNMNVHEELLALLRALNQPEAFHIDEYLGVGNTLRRLRSLPVLIQLPGRLSTTGLFGTEYVDDGGIRVLRGHRWGAHDVTLIAQEEPFIAAPPSLRISISERSTDRAGSEFIGATAGFGPEKEPFFAACENALAGRQTLGRNSSPDWDLELLVERLPKLSVGYAWRRGLQLVVEALAIMDAPLPRELLYLIIPGIGQQDLADVQRRVRAAVGEEVTVVWIDPDVDLVKTLTKDWSDNLRVTIADAIGRVERTIRRTSDDLLAGRFGLVETRHGRTLAIEHGDRSAIVTVRATDNRPVRGYVAFYHPVRTRIDTAIESVRVRATNGEARCKLPLFEGEYSIGAVIEDEGLALEGFLRVHTVLPNIEGEFAT